MITCEGLSDGVLAPGDLLLVAGNGQFLTHPIEGRDIVIGRDPTCDLQIDHRSLSRRHAVFRAGPPPTVQDLGSTNGTVVGGQKHHGGEPVPLAAGNGFRVGPFSVVVVLRAAGDTSLSVTGRDALRVNDPTPSGVPSLVREFAAKDTSILILGETGVGKEVLASTLHELSGRRGPMTRINCAALNESLLESELFGHEKGAFTGAGGRKVGLIEAADGGTVFLDEIGEMPPAIQAKLLRAVEHREVLRLGSTRPTPIDVRFIAATNRDLAAQVSTGAFRRDLYFRLDGVTLIMPPLRERRGAIGRLALELLAGMTGAGEPSVRLGADVLAALDAYPWPGNVRELRAVLERAVVLARGGDVGVRHLRFARQGALNAASEDGAGESAARSAFGQAPSAPPPPSLQPRLDAVAAPPAAESVTPRDDDFLDDEQRSDRDRVLQALEECAGNQTRAARMLGMSRTAFVTRLRIYRIPRPRA